MRSPTFEAHYGVVDGGRLFDHSQRVVSEYRTIRIADCLRSAESPLLIPQRLPHRTAMPVLPVLHSRELLHALSHVQKRSAIGDFFSLPMILGFIVLLFLAIGIGAFVKIWRGDDGARRLAG
ncbi:hypothetical protein VTL71DRAFT_8014, partial [Oculimacula yallundae]